MIDYSSIHVLQSENDAQYYSRVIWLSIKLEIILSGKTTSTLKFDPIFIANNVYFKTKPLLFLHRLFIFYLWTFLFPHLSDISLIKSIVELFLFEGVSLKHIKFFFLSCCLHISWLILIFTLPYPSFCIVLKKA